MTLPNERNRAILNTYDFLCRLMSPYVKNGIKKIPMAVRQEARALLKHYPQPYEIEKLAKKCPDILKGEK